MKNLLVILVFMIGCIGDQYLSTQDETYTFMQQGFKTLPAKAHPIVYHWWLGGNVDTLRLKEELISLKNAGVSGFTIFEIGSRDTVLVKSGPAFFIRSRVQKCYKTVRCVVEVVLSVLLTSYRMDT